jgi:hypothetical protein
LAEECRAPERRILESAVARANDEVSHSAEQRRGADASLEKAKTDRASLTQATRTAAPDKLDRKTQIAAAKRMMELTRQTSATPAKPGPNRSRGHDKDPGRSR